MISIEAPARIKRADVMAFVKSLGVDPLEAVSLTIDRDGVHLIVMARDENGKHYLNGKDVATHDLSIKFADDE